MDNQYINLNVNEYGVVPMLHVSRIDSGRNIICNITDMQIPSGSSAQFGATKPSGLGIYNNATISGNAVTVNLSDQTLAELGCLRAQIKITNNSVSVKTFHFLIIVHENYMGDHLESENESTFLDSLLEQMQQQLNAAIQQGESDIDTMITQAQSDINAAVSAAGTATSAANQATDQANNAASAANQAAEAANQAAETVGGMVDDIGNTPITFTQAAERTNLATGDTVKTAFGKIMKWFADLGAAAFQAVANNLTTTVAGSVLDARQGKILSDNIASAQNALQTQIGDLEDLDTTAKNSVVSAVNELNSKLDYEYVNIEKPSNIPGMTNVTNYTVEAWRLNGWVRVYTNIKADSVQAQTYITVATLPVGFRIRGTTLLRNYITQNGVPMLLSINSDGQIQIYKASSGALTNDWALRQDITYPASAT